MNTIQVNGNTYVTGLMWTRLPGDKPSAEISATVKEYQMKFGIYKKKEDKHHLGLIADKSSYGKYSAASILAEYADDIVLVERISNDKFWVCSINGGDVLPGSDIVVTTDSVKEYVSEFASVPSFGAEGIRIYCSEEVLQEVDIEVDAYLSFEDIIEDAKPEKGDKIVKIKGGTSTVVIGLAIITLIGGSAGGFYYTAEQDRMAELQQIQNSIDFNRSKSNVVDMSKVIEGAKSQESQWLDQDFTERSPEVVLNSVIDLLRNIDSPYKGGWFMSSVFLDKENESIKKLAIAEWNKIDGTTGSLKETLKANSYNFKLSGREASTMHMLPLPTEKAVGVYKNYILGKKESYLDVMDALGPLGGRWQMSEDKKKNKRPKPVLVPEGGDEAFDIYQRQLPLKIKNFEMRNVGFESLVELRNILGEHKNVLITKVSISYDKELSWLVTGEIYEN